MKERLKVNIGRILCWLMPKKHNQLRRNFTIPSAAGDKSYRLTARLMRSAILEKALEKNNGTESIHQDFWREQQPSQWYEQTADRFVSTHQPVIFPIAESIIPLLQEKGIKKVVEFGCGNGTWLAHLKDHWPIDEFIGVDISEQQIQQCRESYPDIQFIASDIINWMEVNAADLTAYHTNCGVLEYLSQASVENLFQLIANSGNNLLFLIEPLAEDYHLESETDSRIYGIEHSYAHNHPHLLKRSGFEILQYEEVNILNTRMQIIVAV